MKLVIKNKNEYVEKIERAEALIKELRDIFAWNLSGEIEAEVTAEDEGTEEDKGTELNGDETICIAQHLMAQHRQTVFERKASIGEACENCPIRNKCIDENLNLWSSTYKKICNSVGIKGELFRISKFPLKPYEK